MNSVAAYTAAVRAHAAVFPPPPAHVDNMKEQCQAARERASATGSPDDDSDWIMVACELEDALADHCRVTLERAVGERRDGAAPVKSADQHVKEAMAVITEAVGEVPWESGADISADGAFRRYLDTRMLLDHHSIADCERAFAKAVELVDEVGAELATTLDTARDTPAIS